MEKKKILWVEDKKELYYVLKFVLEDYGRITFSSTLEDAKYMAKNVNFDLYLCDGRINGDDNGWKLFRAYLGKIGKVDVPFMVVTVHDGIKEEAESFGVASCSKLDIKGLERKVVGFIGQAA